MSEIKVNSIKGVAASAAAISVDNSNGTCTLASGSKLNNCTTDGTTNLTIADGNLVIGTSGHGIDFGATSNSGGTVGSEILSDYEEGTFSGHGTDTGGTEFSTGFTGKYTKIGNMVRISIFNFAYGGTANKDMAFIDNLPFAAPSEPNATGVIVRYAGGNNSNINNHEPCYISQGGTQIRFNGTAFATGSNNNWTLTLLYMVS
tara:strand:+ start:72 stop:680 length:609 start_codon:yes stop_codon:yes gene_type:complete